MAIVHKGKNKYLVRIYKGRDPVTKKRLEFNKTVRGKAAANKLEAKLKGIAKSGKLARSSRMTLNTFLDHYLDTHRHRHVENTQNKNKKCFSYYIRPYLGSRQVGTIKSSDLQKLFNYLLDKKEDTNGNKEKEEGSYGLGLALSTVKGIRRTLWGVFTFAVEEQLLNENPIRKTKLPEVEDISANPLTMEEALKFVAVENSFWYRDAFVFQLHTGVRPQELMALIWDDIDFDKQTVRIERSCKWLNERFTGFGPPKSARSKRTIEITPEVIELLRRHRKKQQREIDKYKKGGAQYGELKLKEWITKNRSKQKHLYNSANLIFPSVSGTVPNPQILRRQFKEMLRCAGISRSGIRWFDLRHTHACVLISLGVPEVEIAERLGHSLTTFHSTYANVLPDRRRVAATVLGNVLPVLIPDSNDNPSKKSEEN